MTFAEWNHGLLFAAVLMVMGAMLLVSAAAVRDRQIALGVLSQAIVVAFSTSGVFYGRSDLLLAAISLVVVAGLWSWLVDHSQFANDVALEHPNGSGFDTKDVRLHVGSNPPPLPTRADAVASPTHHLPQGDSRAGDDPTN